jgi:thioredoxin-like negative regulator of GroEL
VTLAKVDVDSPIGQELSRVYSVSSVPLVCGLVDGKQVASFVGAQPESEVTKFVESLLAAKKQ